MNKTKKQEKKEWFFAILIAIFLTNGLIKFGYIILGFLN